MPESNTDIAEIANRDELELVKLTFELPKFTLNISLFLATAAAFLVRENMGIASSIYGYVIGILYVFGILLTALQFFSSYNFVGDIFNHSRKVKNSDFLNNFNKTMSKKYKIVSRLSRITIFYWIAIITCTVVISSIYR